MPKKLLNLIKGDRISSETDYRDALPVNMIGVARSIHGVQGYMLQHSGLSEYATGLGVDRGGLWNERFENHYRVSGGSLVRVDTDGTVVDLGVVGGTGAVSMPYSFNTQGIVSGGKFWLYDGTTLSEVIDPDLGNPIDCVWVDGYYFFTDGEYIYHTNITSESEIDPLKFATAEFMPDKSLAVAKTQDNKVMVFGRYSIEYFQNAAADNFAFTRLPTRASKIGLVGTHCKTEAGGRWYILGGRKGEGIGVHTVGVGQEQRVSTREVEKVIGKYSETELSGVVVESRQEDAYQLVIVHLPNETLVFNETLAASGFGLEQAWSVIKSDVSGDEQWRGKHGVFVPTIGKWIYGDKLGANIGILDESVATEYGNTVEWLLYTPFVNLERQSIDELEIEVIPGFTAAKDAKVSISMTYNGISYGKEWFDMYGMPSDYCDRFLIRRLGHIRDWVGFRIRGASTSRMAFSMASVKHG